MAPPELARDAPVADVLHPVEERLVPVVGDELDAAFVHRVHGFVGQRLGFHEPLRGDQRLHDGAAAIALADGQRVRLDLCRAGRVFRDRRPRACARRSDPGPRKDRLRRSCARLRRSLCICGRLWRLPASRSFGSCAGVTFTTPVPNSGSATSSKMIGISRFMSGRITVLPARSLIARDRSDSQPPQCRPASFPGAWWRPPDTREPSFTG